MVVSDCGTNFVGAVNELKELYNQSVNEKKTTLLQQIRELNGSSIQQHRILVTHMRL